MKVAIVYDRVNKWGGAERVLMVLHELFPKAPLYCAVYSPQRAPWARAFPQVIPSFLNKIPILRDHHELLGAFTPLAFETFDFSGYDLVISVTSEAAKGIITKPNTRHLCYCLTPTRYLWSGYKSYLHKPQKPLSLIPFYQFLSLPILNYVKKWDRIAANRPDQIIAISSAVQHRIKKYYQRDAKVIFPPVNIAYFSLPVKDGNFPSLVTKLKKKGYFLVVSRLIPYKKVDLVIKVFNHLKQKLVVIGRGSEETRLKRMAKENIIFISEVDDQTLACYYQNAQALIMPQEEDFGLVAVEALACGTPVIAYALGGVRDSVVEGENGILFRHQTEALLFDALKRFARMKVNPEKIKEYAERFSKDRFKQEFLRECNV